MAEPQVFRPVDAQVGIVAPARARLLLLVLLAGCSSGWSNATPEVAPEQSSKTAASNAKQCALPGSAANDVAAAEAGSSDPLSVKGFSIEASPTDSELRLPASAELYRLRFAAQRRVLGRECPPEPLALSYASTKLEFASINASNASGAESAKALGHFVAIEQESALSHFHEALKRLAAGEDEDGKVRILVYGASHTQADTYPSYLRTYLQSRFGDGGQGFLLIGRVNRWHRPFGMRARHRELRVLHSRSRHTATSEPLGLFGAALVGRNANAHGEIVTSKSSPNTQFEVQYYKQPKGGDFTVQLDGQTVAVIKTHSNTPEPGYHQFIASAGAHKIRAQLRGNGPVRLFGVVAETERSGVVVDTLGIGGSRMADSLRWQEDAWIDAVRHRNPDLVTFAYGTNEAMDAGGAMAAYEQQLRAVLTRLRKAVPHVSCVLLAPFDVPKSEKELLTTRPRLLKVMDVQRSVSQEFGCGFWDGYAFMGGAGSMHRWASAKPPLASADHIHLTRMGYVYAGVAIGDALMRAYDLDAVHRGSVSEPAASSP